ncbi:MAG: tetratricopeptide repeat protein, partial [Candidatus Delongbacteria bacterium]
MKKMIFMLILFTIILPSYSQSRFRFSYKINCFEDQLKYCEGEERADLLINLSALYITKFNKIHKGIEFLLEARDLAEQTGYADGLIASYETLGDIYLATRNYSVALDYYKKKSEILSSENRDREFVSALLKMADVSVNAKNFDKTLYYAQKAIELSDSINDQKALPRANYFLALAYRGKFNYKKALEYTNIALNEAKKQEEVYYVGHSYNGIGDLNEMMGNYETALINYKKAAEIFENTRYMSGLTVVYFNLASMHKVFGRYNEALKYLNKSLKMALEQKNEQMIKDNYLGFYGIYNLLKDFEKANKYYMLLNSYTSDNESIFIPLSKIEIDYEISKKQTANELLGLKIEQERNMRYIYVAVFAFILALTYLFFYRKLKQRKINELRLEERRIRAELSSLQSKINPHFLFNSLSSISELITLDPDSAKKMLQNISNLLRYSLRTSKNEFVKLTEEIRMVKKYLEIEKIRFGRRMNFVIDIPETLSNMHIPPL